MYLSYKPNVASAARLSRVQRTRRFAFVLFSQPHSRCVRWSIFKSAFLIELRLACSRKKLHLANACLLASGDEATKDLRPNPSSSVGWDNDQIIDHRVQYAVADNPSKSHQSAGIVGRHGVPALLESLVQRIRRRLVNFVPPRRFKQFRIPVNRRQLISVVNLHV